MNTTNLITDYIIVGVLGLLTLLLPYLMLDSYMITVFINTEIKNAMIITIVMTVIIYSFGVIYNQFADFFEIQICRVLRINVVEDSIKMLKSETSYDYHYALQHIICASESAYDYISFRRTMIRIIRAFVSMSILIPFLHFFYSMCCKMSGYHLSVSSRNVFLILISLIFSILSMVALRKLYKGYFAAIINFVKIIQKDEGH